VKLHADPITELNTVTAYGPDFIEINRVRHTGAIWMVPDQAVTAWEVAHFDALQAVHFEVFLAARPDVVLLGTGEIQRFPHPRLLHALALARIGVEAMDTRAACRTYNILVAEGRRVLAALLPGR
jgi:uncharacterized protein